MAGERIGFIGLGLMGRAMARNVLTKGFALTVMAHRSRGAVDELVGLGAEEAATPAEMAGRCDIVVLCVTGSPQVEAVLLGADGIASAGRELVVMDCSTSDPSSTLRLAAELSPRGIALVDAPLSRTPKDAEAGTLDVMAAGDDALFARIEPVLRTFAGRIVRTGPVGTGHTMKLLNNFVSLGYAALYSEALALGARAGLTPQVFDAVIRDGRMDCAFYRTFATYVLERDRNAHRFSIANALKDLTYLSAQANASGAVNPLGAAVRNAFAGAAAAGMSGEFVPMLSDFVAAQNGVSLTA